MKILIIHFSQTNYTKKVAQCISEGAAAEGAECRVVSIIDVEKSTVGEYDLVGIGCPVFYYQEPFNVRWFIEDLPSLTGQSWFVFCTHGSMRGFALEFMARDLAHKGARVIGYHDTYAHATAPFIPGPTLTTGHPDEIGYEEARGFGREIVDRARKIAAGESVEVPVPEPMPEKYRIRSGFMTPLVLEIYLPKLEVDLLSCTLCRTCEKRCPVGGIDIDACPPRLQDPCIWCYHCVMMCPEVAIDAKNSDWKWMRKEIPGLYAEFRPLLEKDAARGKYRFITDPDSLDYSITQLDQRKQKNRQRKKVG